MFDTVLVYAMHVFCSAWNTFKFVFNICFCASLLWVELYLLQDLQIYVDSLTQRLNRKTIEMLFANQVPNNKYIWDSGVDSVVTKN